MIRVLERILIDLNRTEGLRGSLVVSKEGLIMSQHVPDSFNSDLIGALTTNVITASQKTLEQLGLGVLQAITVEGSEGKTVVMEIGDVMLIVMTEPSVNLGMVKFEIYRAASRVKTALRV